MENYDEQARQTVLQGRTHLERMAESLANSHRVAIESEQIGTAVIAELGEQRESLLRSKQRLENTDQALQQSRSVLRRMTLTALSNKIILIFIILVEMGILGCTVYLKHFKS